AVVAAPLPPTDGSTAAYPRTGRRHDRVARHLPAGAGEQRPVLARSPPTLHRPPALDRRPTRRGGPALAMVRGPRRRRRRPGRCAMTASSSPSPRVAVVGSGVAGLTAAYLLRKRYEVTLFEADDRLGGHAHTHSVPTSDGRAARIDTGFIVHNEKTYPNLLRLFVELGVSTQDSEMSMSVRCQGCGLEYAGARGARGLFAAPGNLARPAFLRLLGEVPRFHRAARRLLAEPEIDDTADGGPSLGAFLASGGYSRYFVDHFIMPLVSAVWSAGPRVSAQYPARYLFEFLYNHGMLPSAARRHGKPWS